MLLPVSCILVESCDSWYTTYYTDLNCTDVYSVVKLNDYTDCRVATDLKISNLVSVRGKCALSSSPLPVSVDSFIIR